MKNEMSKSGVDALALGFDHSRALARKLAGRGRGLYYYYDSIVRRPSEELFLHTLYMIFILYSKRRLSVPPEWSYVAKCPDLEPLAGNSPVPNANQGDFGCGEEHGGNAPAFWTTVI